MSLVELLKYYNKQTDSLFMYDVINMMSKELEDANISDERMQKIMKCVYCKVEGCHYNELFADEQVSKMYFVDKFGVKRYGPFISKLESEDLYQRVKSRIRGYNKWDFFVTLQMIYSDNYDLFMLWFGNMSKEQLIDKVVDMSVAWLKDEDNPYGGHKIWGYFNKID